MSLTVFRDDIVVAQKIEDAMFYKVKPVVYEEKKGYERIKRIFDFTVSLLALIVFAIPMLLISLIIRLDSEGGAIYKQERLGKNGKPFVLYKFRTMRADAEKNGAQWATVDDDRCTRAGKVLRKARMDELMQLINILKGDMSIIGPRPERKIFYDKFATYIDGFDQRLLVKPGLTGLAQINGGYNLEPYEKIIPDVEYIENRSVWLDIKIMLKTVTVVFSHDGAR